MPGTLDAPTLRRAMLRYADSLRRHRHELNSLNVYPVPDGDSGTNMLRTQEAVVRDLEFAAGDGADAGDAIAAVISRASLMGARGNSGVILAQVLRAMCERLDGSGSPGPHELAGALQAASDDAWRAVASPQEGTVLSVVRDAAGAAAQAAEHGADVAGTLEAAVAEARRSLERTRYILPELQRAGVVDAGAKGIVLLFDALSSEVSGRLLEEPVGPSGPIEEPAGSPGPSDHGPHPASPPHGRPEFEVQYLLEAPDEALGDLRRQLDELGESLVVVGGRGLYKVHVHTDRAGAAVEAGLDAGRPREISITGLQDRTAECIGGQARGVQATVPAHGIAEPGLARAERVPGQVCTVVAVAEGEGVQWLFRSLGADVVTGGPGNNPAVADLLEATEAAEEHDVLLLPNHPNVIPAAERAARSSSRHVLVLGARSIPAGIAAATAFNPLAGPQENARAMDEAAARCGSGGLARSDRDAGTPMGPVTEGDWLGLAEQEVVHAGPSAAEAAVAVAGRLGAERADVVTLVAGRDATDRDRAEVERAIRAAFEGPEVQVLDGGQPRFPFLIGVE